MQQTDLLHSKLEQPVAVLEVDKFCLPLKVVFVVGQVLPVSIDNTVRSLT